MSSPGRPADPTVHPRTRPEAEDNAIKMRGTGDWFRHDGKNVEEPTVPAARLQGYQAPEIAEKNSGETEPWYEHDPKNPATPKAKPVPRCSTNEAKECKDKILGREEAWFKMEENKDYHTPRPKSRVTSVQGQECLEKLGKADTMNWYRHEHQGGDTYTPPPAKSRTGPMPYADEIKEKLNPQGKQPDWYSTDKKQQNGESHSEAQPASRVNTADAKGYLDRNRGGSATDWYGHDPTVQNVASPRSSKMGKESENWFNHNEKRDAAAQPKPHVMTESARNMVEKSRGNEMQGILGGQKQDVQDGTPARVKPEGQEIARKGTQGIMDKYMNQDGNANYNSSRAGGRAVKPEAQEIAAKNKGMMSDTMSGHPMGGGARDYNKSRVVKPEAAENAARNKGTMGNIIGGSGGEASARPNPRVKTEATNNANKHQGQGMSAILGGVGSMDVSQRAPAARVQSASARAAAERNRGTIGDIFKMQ